MQLAAGTFRCQLFCSEVKPVCHPCLSVQLLTCTLRLQRGEAGCCSGKPANSRDPSWGPGGVKGSVTELRLGNKLLGLWSNVLFHFWCCKGQLATAGQQARDPHLSSQESSWGWHCFTPQDGVLHQGYRDRWGGRAAGPPAEVDGQHWINVFLKILSYGPWGLFQK